MAFLRMMTLKTKMMIVLVLVLVRVRVRVSGAAHQRKGAGVEVPCEPLRTTGGGGFWQVY